MKRPAWLDAFTMSAQIGFSLGIGVAAAALPVGAVIVVVSWLM